ncbi:SAM-dependent methyltransferase [Actinoplanes sp. TRM 88003]|uniref:SAM-dependent methyltransferase n=2 Tax=Paractinoplanes aksuensis TaxID=2939490 RepID=A0ABT1E114_9ACTN|nr:SAM-dependent methyltransferase [Actinoplanes aksuensis]
MEIWNATANPPYAMRSPAEIAAYFDGLEFVEPGLVDVTEWRPEAGDAKRLDNLIGLARK